MHHHSPLKKWVNIKTWIETSERRRYPRANHPWLRVETEGFAYIVRDWSVGGIAIEHFHNAGPIGAFAIGEAGWADGETLTPFTADITRRESDGTTVLRWLDISKDLLTELDHMARHR